MVQLPTNQNILFGYILESLGIEIVCTFCGHLEYFTPMSYVLWPFGIFCGHLVIFYPVLVYFGIFGIFWYLWYILWSFDNILPRFDMLCRVKSGNPAPM
jgi:hypothetical protein